MLNAVTYILENAAAVQALVGLNATRDKYKVYPVIAPQNETAPYIAVRIFGRVRQAKDCDWNWTVQVVAYANSYDDVAALSEEIMETLDGQTPATINGEEFGFLNLTNEQDEFIKEHNLYAKILTFEGM